MLQRKPIIFVLLALATSVALFLSLETEQKQRIEKTGKDIGKRERQAPPTRTPQQEIVGSKGGSEDLPVDKMRISGIVIGIKGVPIPEAIVDLNLMPWQVGVERLYTPTRPQLAPKQKTITTDRFGRFLFPVLSKSEEVWLTARDKTDTMSGQLRLHPSSLMNDLRIKISPGSVISGTVVDTNGRPLANLTVGAFHTDDWDPGRVDELANGDNYGLTDELGKFVLRGLQPGTLFMRIIDEGRIIADNEAIQLGESAITNVTLRTQASLAIEGQVLDQNRRPIAGAQVIIKPEIGGWRENRMGGTTESDEKGLFRLGGLRPGAYTVLVQGGYDATSKPQDTNKRRKAILGRFKRTGVSAGAPRLDVTYRKK